LRLMIALVSSVAFGAATRLMFVFSFIFSQSVVADFQKYAIV